jgi:AraC-like DNA-binding protein
VFEYANFQGFKLLGIGQVIFYGVWVFIYLRNYKKDLGNFSSFKEGLELKWLNAFTVSFVLAAVIFGATKMKVGWISFFYPAVLFHILYSGFFVIKRNFRLYKLSLEAEFNSKQEEKKIEEKIEFDLEEKYKNSSLRDEERIQTIKKEIIDLMVNHKAFTDPSLTVFKMGKELEVNSKYVSQVVNQEFNKNFISFVNEFRVKEVQEMMTEARYENLTLEGMALKAGFKSKSSFNIAFKKEIGMTPSQYRKEMSVD